VSRGANPMWRKAPLLLFRWPPILAAVGASFVILVVTAAIAPLFTSSAASGALFEESRGLGRSAIGFNLRQETPLVDFHVPRPGGGRRVLTPNQLFDERTLGLNRRAARIDNLGSVTRSIFLAPSSLEVGSSISVVRPVARERFLDHINVIEETSGDGFYVAEPVADELGVKPGDMATMTADSVMRIRIKGIYEDLISKPSSEYWRPLNRYIYRLKPADARPPALLLSDLDLLLAAGTEMESRAVEAWEYPIELDGLTLDSARRIADEITTLSRTAVDQDPLPGGATIFLEPEVHTLLPVLVDGAEDIVASIQSPVQVLVLTGAAVALLLICVSAYYMVQKRGIEFRLLEARGVSDRWVAGRACVETVVPILLASVVGAGGTWVLVNVFGPGPVDANALKAAAFLTIGSVLVGLIALGIATAIAARRLASIETGGTNITSRLPWEILLLIAAGVSLYFINQRGAISEQDDGGGVDLLLVLFPMFGVAGGALFVLKVLFAYLGKARGATAGASTSVYLATRRLVAGSRSVALLIGAAAVSVGILVYSTSLLASVKATTYAKTHVFTGSDVSLQVSTLDLPKPDIPHTVVATADGDVGNTAVAIMGVDPETFVDAAFWDSSFSDSSVESLVDAVDEPGAGPLPVVVVGDEDLSPGSFSVSGNDVGVEVVGRASTWPGMLAQTPMLVASLPQLIEIAREDGIALPRLTLWARGPIDEVVTELQRAGIDTQLSVTANEVGETSKLLSISWTFGLLRILGIVAGVLAVVGMLLYVAARRRTRLVSYLLAKRMGLPVRDHRMSVLIELFSMLAAALVLGGALGIASARLIYVGLDLLPTVPPAPLFRVPSVEVVATGVLFGVAAVVGAALIQRASDRARPGEVMRLAD